MIRATSRRTSLRQLTRFAGLVVTLVPILAVGLLSFYTIRVIVRSTVIAGLEGTLSSIGVQIQTHMNNLDYNSRQFAYEGEVSRYYTSYYMSSGVMERFISKRNLRSAISFVSNIHPEIGYIEYATSDPASAHDPLSLDVPIDFDRLPLLFKRGDISFYGPHDTVDSLQDGLVFSVRRPVEFPGFNSHVFIESEIGFVDRLLFVERFGTEPRYVFAADDGRVVFSMVPHIEVGSVVETATPTVPGLVTLTLLDDSVPWQIYGFLSRSDMLAPLRTWVFQYLLVLAASVAVFVVVTRLGWNAMSRRLDDVGERVRLLTEQGFDEEVTPIGVEEFDAVLGQMEGLRQRVVSLIEQVRDESAQRHASELEALRSQINPHFLHNTLNIIQWIAKMNGQNQIDRIAAILTRLLHHGLGREGPTVTLREELDAVRDYLELQRFRFDFEYRIDVALAEDALDLQIPRFLLQPVVENALYHGLDRGRGRITVLATHNGDQIRFHVKDNGKGIGPEEIDALLSDRGPNTRHGIGIGLRYVSSTLADRYGDHASLNVSSRPGEGTLFAVEIPVAR